MGDPRDSIDTQPIDEEFLEKVASTVEYSVSSAQKYYGHFLL